MKLILKYLLTLIYTIGYTQNAAIGIDTNSPQGILDINSINSGIIFPKIALQSVFDEVTITNANPLNKIAEGTIIWNTSNNTSTVTTANSKLIPGLYIWKNPRWRRLLDQTSVIKNVELGKNTPDFTSTSCTSSVWTELTSNLGTTFSVNEDEISNISFYFNGQQNYICDLELVLNFKGKHPGLLEIFLKSPTGDLIELMDGNGPISLFDRTFTSKFTGNSSTSIDTWSTGNFNTPDVRPKGITTPSLLTSHFSKSTINNFTDLMDKNPQGEWEIIINNRSLLYPMDISDIKLRIRAREDYSNVGNYKLAKQITYDTKDLNTLVLSSIFEAQIKSNILHTVITQTTTPVTVDNTTDISLLNIKSVNSKMNTGVSWVQSNNQMVDKNLPLNTTYFYQLWYKADVHNDNKKHNITINGFSN